MNPYRVRVKICGMTRLEDIAQAIDLGVDALGFIFYPHSPRHVSIDQIKPWLTIIPPFVDRVAVLVDPEKAFVEELIQELPIQLLQFHGDESPEFCNEFTIPYIKSIRPHTTKQIQEAAIKYSTAQALLLDTPSKTEKGGTGLAFDWQIIPETLAKPLVLAGGLNEFNIQDAIKQCKPYAVDLCSGVEEMPGFKDHMKMTRFIKALWDRS